MAGLSGDFDSLAVDDRFETRGRTITEADVVSFACLTGDMHPLHTDRAFARSSPFGERIAHGMLVVSFAIGLLDHDPEHVLALRRVRDAVFKRPVLLGDTIHACGRVARLDEVDRVAGLVGIRLELRNQREELVATVALELLWRRGSAQLPAIAADELFVMDGLPI